MLTKIKDRLIILFARATGREVQIARTTGDGEMAINVSKDGEQIAITRGKNSAAINIRTTRK